MGKEVGQRKFTLEQIRAAAKAAGIGADVVEQIIVSLASQQPQATALTIICNKGIHAIPEEALPGRKLAATTGNLPEATADELTVVITEACLRVARVLKYEGPFTEIYLVPSGYGVILQKLAETVFQITGKPAITLHYDRPTGQYWPFNPNLREIVSKA